MKKFRTAKVGDKVWCVKFGWGVIASINDDEIYGIRVEYIDTKGMTQYYSFTPDGKDYPSDINPILFWNEIKLPTTEEDKRPFNLVEFLKDKTESIPFEGRGANYYIYYDSSRRSFYYDYVSDYDRIGTVYLRKDGIQDIVKELNKNKATQQQLKDTYKKLGWI